MSKPQPSSLLDHYHCTFFLPLLGLPDNFPTPKSHLRKIYPPGNTDSASQSAATSLPLKPEDIQSYHYFTPTLRKILFDPGRPVTSDTLPLQAVEEWQLPQALIQPWQLVLHPTAEQQRKINATQLNDIDQAGAEEALYKQSVGFLSVRLYKYFNGIYLLAFTVEPQVLKALRAKGQSEVSLFADDAPQLLADYSDDPLIRDYEQLQLESWLRFSRLARQLYPTFTEQAEENKIANIELRLGQDGSHSALNNKMSDTLPQQGGEALSSVIPLILQYFFEKPIEATLRKHIQLFDDRLFISVAYGLAGKPYDYLEQVKTLINFTDRFDDDLPGLDGYPYTKSATDPLVNASNFDWWSGLGGHYQFNDMVNAYLYNGWTFRNIIAPKVIPFIYDRMMIQALFYQASLRHYDQQITLKTGQLLKEEDPETAIEIIRQQREDFIRFTNQYWFQEVTNQMQGKEIFRLQQRGLGIQAHYEQLQDEISHTNDYLQTLQDSQASDNANRIAWGAVVLAAAAALPVVNDIFKAEDDSLWKLIINQLQQGLGLSDITAKAGLSVGLSTLIVVIMWLIMERRK